MKKIYLFALGVFLVSTAFGQTVIEPPVVAIEGITVIDTDVPAYSEVINQSQEEKEYMWQRNVIELTEGWATAVCDLNLCHLPFVEDATFMLGGNSAGTLDVHVYPNGLPGGAIVEVTVVNVNDENDFATGVYYFNQALSAPERINEALKVYPNPAVGEFFVEGGEAVERLEIYDVSGKLLKEFGGMSTNAFNVSDLESGNYIVRMWDGSDQPISTNVLTVQ